MAAPPEALQQLGALDAAPEVSPSAEDPADVEIPTGTEWKPTDSELATFSIFVRTAFDPESAVNSILTKQPRGEQLETLQRLYPDLLLGVREVLASEIRKQAARGATYSMDEEKHFSMILGRRPKMYDPELVAMLQGNFRRNQEQEEAGGGKPTKYKTKTKNVASPYQTRMDRLQGKE